MSYRDDLQAAHERIAALQWECAHLRASRDKLLEQNTELVIEKVAKLRAVVEKRVEDQESQYRSLSKLARALPSTTQILLLLIILSVVTMMCGGWILHNFPQVVGLQ